MRKINFTIEGRLPGLNEIIKEALTNRYGYGDFKRQATATCKTYMDLCKVPKFKGPISIHIKWFEPNRKRDLDNIFSGQKFLIDSLVVSGRIPNDTQRFVKKIEHELGEPDKKNPRIEVCITEDEGPSPLPYINGGE